MKVLNKLFYVNINSLLNTLTIFIFILRLTKLHVTFCLKSQIDSCCQWLKVQKVSVYQNVMCNL